MSVCISTCILQPRLTRALIIADFRYTPLELSACRAILLSWSVHPFSPHFALLPWLGAPFPCWLGVMREGILVLCPVLSFKSSLLAVEYDASSAFPGGTSGEKPALQCGRQRKPGCDPRVRKTPWRRARHPTWVFLPGESQGQWSLVGCHLWGRTESDMTEAT